MSQPWLFLISFLKSKKSYSIVNGSTASRKTTLKSGKSWMTLSTARKWSPNGTLRRYAKSSTLIHSATKARLGLMWMPIIGSASLFFAPMAKLGWAIRRKKPSTDYSKITMCLLGQVWPITANWGLKLKACMQESLNSRQFSTCPTTL